MDPETRRLQILRRDLRSGSVFDCLFSVAMVVSIATTLGLSASEDCQQLPSRFAFCIPCENRLVIWGIVASPVYSALFFVRCKMYMRLESGDVGQVHVLMQSAIYRCWRVINMLNGAWTMLGAIWYFNRSECSEAPNYLRLMYFVNILFWLSISKYMLIALIWMILFCMVRMCPNHPLVMRLFGSMAQPFTDGVQVEPGATAEQLSMFPVFMLPQPEGSPDYIAVEDRECAICLCPYEDEQPIKRMFCRHHYHSVCIDQWLSSKSTCPLCNSNVLSHLNLPSAPVTAESASPQSVTRSFGGTARGPGNPASAGESVVEFRISLPQQPVVGSSDAFTSELSEFFDGQ
jgi:hypothetical protein